MKRLPLPVFVLLLMTLTAFAADIPKFEDYPATEVYQGKNAPVNLASPEAREFRTRLKEAALEKPNFAGHYILAKWGCGSGCLMPAIIDAKNGRVFMLPFTITTVGEKVIDPVQFRLDSRLLVVNGSRNEQDENGTFYYLWNGKQLKLVTSTDASASQRYNFIGDDSFIIGCFDTVESKFLKAAECEKVFAVSDQIEFTNGGKMGINTIFKAIKMPGDQGPPCEGTLLMNTDEMKKVGEKIYKAGVLKPAGNEYGGEILSWLKKKHPFLEKIPVHVRQLIRADLNGDGKDEILFNVSTKNEGEQLSPPVYVWPPESRTYDKDKKYYYYAGVGIRYSDGGGKVHISEIYANWFDETKIEKTRKEVWHMQAEFKISGFSDTNNDGGLEIIIRDSYYEGSGSGVYVPEDKNFDKIKQVSTNGCGA